MQGFNKKEGKLLELKLTQCKRPKVVVDVIMSKFNTLKYNDKI